MVLIPAIEWSLNTFFGYWDCNGTWNYIVIYFSRNMHISSTVTIAVHAESCTDAWWTSVVSSQMSIIWKQVQVWRENQHEMTNGFTDLVFKCAIYFHCDIFYRIDSIGLVFRIGLCTSLPRTSA
eukprot:1020343_1